MVKSLFLFGLFVFFSIDTAFAISGQQAYTTPGTYSWTAPAGVTSVSVVCVGGGGGAGTYFDGTKWHGQGGGGGALAYSNSIVVVPGNSYSVVVGAASNLSSFNTTSCAAGAGGNGSSASDMSGGAGGSPIYFNAGGQGGGAGGTGAGISGANGGGGGAAGYTSGGGAGGCGNCTGGSGAGGSGGGGGGSGNSDQGYGAGGGGVGLLGTGSSGAGGAGATPPTNAVGGGGGSGGANGSAIAWGGNYGGGSGGASGNYGAGGAVRIIWGTGRAYPSTNTADIVAPTVSSPTSTFVTNTTATLGANVTSDGGSAITARGICYGTTAAPTSCYSSGTATGVFTQSISGLTPGVLYYYRGYGTNDVGTTYTSDATFTTETIPSISTPTATSIATSSATLGANVTSTGGPVLTSRGTCWDYTPAPTSNCLSDGGSTAAIFTHARTGFAQGAFVYYRGYATNIYGTTYTSDGTFTAVSTTVLATGSDPSTFTLAPGATASTSDTFTFKTDSGTDAITALVLNLTNASSTSLIEITNDAGTVVYGSSTNPTTATTSITLTGLTATVTQTQYRVRITPKARASLTPSTTYPVTTTVASWTGTNTNKSGTDTSNTVNVDNLGPTFNLNAGTFSVTSSSGQSIINYVTPADTDLNSIIVLRSTSAITDVPVSGTTYTAGNTIGVSTVACIDPTTTPGIASSCTVSGLTNGTTYYFKIFAKDNSLNYGAGVTPTNSPSTPNPGTVLATGSDPQTFTLAPGATATTSDTFTLKTDSGTDAITALVLNLTNASSTSLIEITNDAGTTVYGSVFNPTGASVSIPITGLTITNVATQYRVRITPKTRTNLTAATSSPVTTTVASWTGTNANKSGTDTSNTVNVDNLGPTLNVGAGTFSVTGSSGQATINYVAPADLDLNSVVVVYSTSTITSSPLSGRNYTIGDIVMPDVSCLVVAGGGGGGRYGGGGGGGGLIYNSACAGNLQAYSVTVGNGGAGWVGDAQSGGNAASGGNSVFGSSTALGGGGGGNYSNSVGVAGVGGAGGSGGGAGSDGPSFGTNITSPGGTGSASQGYPGGKNSTGYATGGGGGGGAGAIGTDGTAGGPGGVGGIGLQYSISGTPTYYAGGGGGTGGLSSGQTVPGGQGGGGVGLPSGSTSALIDATPNTGGGGGGNSDNTIAGTWRAGNGGSGIVILSAPTASMISATGGAHSTSGGNEIWTFTSSGTWTPTLLTSTPKVGCIDTAVTPGTASSCTITGLTNGVTYYFKIFAKDNSLNYGAGVTPTNSPSIPNPGTVLATGSDPSTFTLAPGATATTSDTFTLKTDTGSDVITALVLNLTNASSTSLIEITNDAGTTVYGSVTNPTGASTSISIAGGFPINNVATQYRVRITPKARASLTASTTYPVTTTVASWTGTNTNKSGTDTSNTVNVDNLGPTFNLNAGTFSVTPSSGQAVVNYVTPADVDLNSTIILYSTSAITDTPASGTTYTVGNIIGVSTVGCIDTTTTPSITSSCTVSGLSNGNTYYFKIFAKDNSLNYGAGVTPNNSPSTPNPGTTLTTGSDPSTFTLAPGATATTSDTFTFKTDSGTDAITALVLNLTNASSTSLIEITNDAGTVVYGSSTNPTFATTSITLTGLTATVTQTQYRVRITPKARASLTASTTYPVTTTVASWTSSAVNKTGTDTANIVYIDRLPPATTYGSGITWANRTSSVSANFTGIAYGNGTFVAISTSGSSNSILTSSDGLRWVFGPNPAPSNNWTSITYGNGLFVAVANYGTNNRVMTSPDGINWTLRTSVPASPADNNWTSVTYGNNLFVAVANSGTGNRVMTSPDGITWTIRTSAADNNWSSVTYGNGLFVAVANSGTGNRVMTSPDGITWNIRTDPSDNAWNSIAYGNGIFVAVSNDGTNNSVMTSTDGMIWTNHIAANNNQWTSVTYGNGLFVAVANSGTGNRVMTSPDGITWTIRPTLTVSDNNWVGVTYGNGTFAAVATSCTNNNCVMVSSSYIPSTTVSSTKVIINYVAPGDTDLNSMVILKSSSAVVDVPVDGTTYAGGETIGASTVACVDTTPTPANPHSCIATGLTNGTAYNFKLFAKDIAGNYSLGLVPTGSPATPTTTPSQVKVASFRFLKDTASQLSETDNAFAPENTVLTSNFFVGDSSRLRLSIINAGSATTTMQFQIQYATSTCTNWTTVPVARNVATQDFRIDPSLYVSDGDPTAHYTTTALASIANKAFLPGRIQTMFNTTPDISLAGNQYTELEYTLRATASLTPYIVYCFRLTNSGDPTDFDYTDPTLVPKITPADKNYRPYAGGGGASAVVSIEAASRVATTTITGGGAAGGAASTTDATTTPAAPTATTTPSGGGGAGNVGFFNPSHYYYVFDSTPVFDLNRIYRFYSLIYSLAKNKKIL